MVPAIPTKMTAKRDSIKASERANEALEKINNAQTQIDQAKNNTSTQWALGN